MFNIFMEWFHLRLLLSGHHTRNAPHSGRLLINEFKIPTLCHDEHPHPGKDRHP